MIKPRQKAFVVNVVVVCSTPIGELMTACHCDKIVTRSVRTATGNESYTKIHLVDLIHVYAADRIKE